MFYIANALISRYNNKARYLCYVVMKGMQDCSLYIDNTGKKEPLKKAQNNKIGNVAGSV